MKDEGKDAMAMRTRRRLILAAASALAGAVLAVGLPSAAWAHVGVSGSSTAAGSPTLLTFAFSHGCGDSPTTRLAIQIPEGIDAVAPTVNPGWTVEKVMATLDAPVTDAHGNQLIERVAQIVYTAKEPVPNGVRDAFVLSLTLPAAAAGQTLAFPTVQTCQAGENAWIELPAQGQDAHDLDYPAPAVVVTAADPAQPEVGASPLVIASLAVGALGLLTGLTALLRSRRQP